MKRIGLLGCTTSLLLLFIGQSAGATEEAQNTPWPFVEPIFTTSAVPSSQLRLRAGFANNPDVDSLAFALEGAFAIGELALHLRMPVGLSMADSGDDFTWGDASLEARFRLHHDPAQQRHLTLGLGLTGPTSRLGANPAKAGQLEDDSNYGKRQPLAQQPLLDLGLVPRLNLAISPWLAFGQNIGRVSLQADLGCLILVMDNLDDSVYGTDRRVGFILFFDLAAPVSITESLAIVTEFNAMVALDKLTGSGFAVTIGPRYTSGGFSVALGAQLPLGVDDKEPDDDKMLGRYDQALVVRHHFAGMLDLAYHF